MFKYLPHAFFIVFLFTLSCQNNITDTALSIEITDGTTIPTLVPSESSTTVYFTVSNLSSLSQYIVVANLPTNVTQNTDNSIYTDPCTASTNLAASGEALSSCTLPLSISGPVDKTQNITVCSSDASSCTTTHFPENISELTSIEIDSENLALAIDATQSLTAVGVLSDDTTSDVTSEISWETSNPDVATVSETGLVTGITKGVSNIKATFGNLESNIKLVGVDNPLISIDVQPQRQALAVSETAELTATGTYFDDSTADITTEVTWTSSETDVATISEEGLATGLTRGLTVVRATHEGVTSHYANIGVDNPLVQIDITTETEDIRLDESTSFDATGTYYDDTTADLTAVVEWLSSDTNIATIDDSGVATGNEVGTSVMSATFENVRSNLVTLRVAPHLAYVSSVDGQKVSVCTVDSTTGLLSLCENFESSWIFPGPTGMAINADASLFYVASIGTNTVAMCSHDYFTGALSACENADGDGSATFSNSVSIRLSASGLYAYVPQFYGESVAICSVDSQDGKLRNCATPSILEIQNSIDVLFNTDNTMAYFTNYNLETTTLCSFDEETQILSDCEDSGATGLDNPNYMVFNTDETRVYVGNYGSSEIIMCERNTDTGTLSGCQFAGVQTNVSNIYLNKEGTLMYVSNYTYNTVSVCEVNEGTGLLENCQDSGGTGFIKPYAIILND